MDENNWQNIKEIFLAALEKDTASRAVFLDEIGANDFALREEIESLLATHEELEDFIEEPAFQISEVFASGANQAEKHFGNYKIINEIGAGGMGAVFLAERDDGEFSQKVAIKIIRQAIAETELINRFKRERQILATLNHPNIAKLLDGGVSADGLPFLAMEFVAGEAITKFAERENLNLEERLKLFLKVCSAVQYAHRNLVVHRDLKPGNILVTREGEPKLLDFGLAKLLDENLSNDTSQTQTAFRALTPAYASPEQLKNEPITTASDIYSLGVVFYELLTGERPFHFEGKSLDEIIKTVTAFEPPLPSANPKSKTRNPKLRGDLDNIALTTLRKEPARRYQSVEAFADDIERYLKGLPVSARSNTFKYRASKFIKRHKVGVLAASLIFLSLIGGIIVSVWEAQIARREKEKAERINAFLEQTLKYSDPILSSLRKERRETTVNDVLDEAARRLDSGEFDNFPEVKSELERTVATTYFGQSKYAQARKHMEQYVILLKGLYGENHPKIIAGSVRWAGLLFAKGEFDEAEKTYRRYLPLLKNEYKRGNINTEELADALNNFAYLRRTQGDSKEAESLFRETLELIPQLSVEARNSVATTRSTMASTIADQGRFDEALKTAAEGVEEYRQRGETDSPSYGFALTIYGGFLAEKGEFGNADTSLREAETIFRKFLSPANLWLGDNLRNQAISLYGQGKYSESIEQANTVLKIYDEGFGKYYDNYPTVLIVKGLSLAKIGQIPEGEKILREAVRLRNESLPKEHFWVAIANSALGECLTMQKRYEEAAPLLAESYENLKNSQGAENPRTQLAKSRLDSLYEKTNRQNTANR
ncbi:MAG TPA: serine/threonine-protein kinase [Pyrinomonadaceae bacterium]|nr:serine/threonine-protein kinase [Pyrinomonadaceae bacterium]